jgi:hypothetical protein
LEQLHCLFVLRARARLVLGQPDGAAEDVLTSLRIAGLARQAPDIESTWRVQMMLAGTLQPVWEGLADHQWNEAQLATLQQQLGRFNLLSDFTNTVQRMVLAHIETWQLPAKNRRIPMRRNPAVYYNYNVSQALLRWEPSGWWLDNAITLYRIGEEAKGRVDAANGQVMQDNNWIDLEGLPLVGRSPELFYQTSWWGGNTPQYFAFTQNALNQAMLAAAIERYRLAQGALPPKLDAVATNWINRLLPDVLTGRPMFYQLAGTNGFELRGVGANGILERTNAVSDDWIWSSAPAAPKGSRPGRRGQPVPSGGQ